MQESRIDILMPSLHAIPQISHLFRCGSGCNCIQLHTSVCVCVHDVCAVYVCTYKCVVVCVYIQVCGCAYTYKSMVVCVLVVCHHVYIRMYVYMCVHVD